MSGINSTFNIQYAILKLPFPSKCKHSCVRNNMGSQISGLQLKVIEFCFCVQKEIKSYFIYFLINFTLWLFKNQIPQNLLLDKCKQTMNTIHQIKLYPVDNVIQLLNKLHQDYKSYSGSCYCGCCFKKRDLSNTCMLLILSVYKKILFSSMEFMQDHHIEIKIKYCCSFNAFQSTEQSKFHFQLGQNACATKT